MTLTSQSDLPIRLTIPGGSNELRVLRFSGSESLSELYSYQIEVVATPKVRAAMFGLLGCSIAVDIAAGAKESSSRRFTGIATEVDYLDTVDSLDRYRIEMSPHVWQLTQNQNCRVFQRQTVVQILTGLLSKFSPVNRLETTYCENNYTVQYNESDFAFAKRLMEVNGIFFYFTHETSDSAAAMERIVLGDNSLNAPRIDGEKLIFDPVAGGARTNARICQWRMRQRFGPAKYTTADHMFQIGDGTLLEPGSLRASVDFGKTKLQIVNDKNAAIGRYEFSCEALKKFDEVDANRKPESKRLHGIGHEAKRITQVLCEELAVRNIGVQASSDSIQLKSGHQFDLVDHPLASDAYLVTNVRHEARQSGPAASGASAFEYRNEFDCIPKLLPYRPERKTPKPIMHGAQTATVVGPTGQPIWADPFGRIKVRFHWDHASGTSGDNSCWMRVASSWSGAGWGKMTLPRVGQEVVVEFMDGDPDRPLVTGSVYNKGNGTPVALPANCNQSVWKSSTVGSNGNTQFSGIGIDDTPGKEYLQFHSERDMMQTVNRNLSLDIGAWQSTNISAGSLRQVGGITNHQSSGGPFQWESTVGHAMALDSNLVLGYFDQSVLGMSKSYCTGWSRDVVFNPLSYLGSATFSGPQTSMSSLTLGLGNLIHGQVRAIQGAYSQLVAGTTLSINRGHFVAGNFELTSPFHSGRFLYWFFQLTRHLRAAYFLDCALMQILAFLKHAIVSNTGDEDRADLAFDIGLAIGETVSSELALYLWTLWEYDAATASVSTDVIRRINKGYDAMFDNANTKIAEANSSYWKRFVPIIKSLPATGSSWKSIKDEAKPDPPPHSYSYSTQGLHAVRACGIVLTSFPLQNQKTKAVEAESMLILESLGTDDKGGNITVNATGKTYINGGSKSYLELTTDNSKGNVVLSCGADGELKIESGKDTPANQIAMGTSGIAVESSKQFTAESSPCKIEIVGGDTKKITVTQGNSNKITMNNESIELMVGSSTLTVKDGEIILNASKVTTTAQGGVTMNTSQFEIV